MLILDDIQVRIGTATLLDDVSLSVKPGEVVAVVGPNGAGKSTLLRVAAGERKPTSGSATLDGTTLDRIDPRQLALHRAVLPQQSFLQFGFTVGEVVLLGRTPHVQRSSRSADLATASWAMEKAGIAHLQERRYPSLSGGEKQRVHLARALAQLGNPESAENPRYLLLDEPTASLDLAHQHAVLQTARDLADSGCGVFVILHDLNLASEYADRLAILSKGKLLADDTPIRALDPHIIEEAFGVPVIIMNHPCRACPLVVTANVNGDRAPVALETLE